MHDKDSPSIARRRLLSSLGLAPDSPTNLSGNYLERMRKLVMVKFLLKASINKDHLAWSKF
jgi:hypothetical protein